MCDVIQAANAAEVILNGYAFTKEGDRLKVLNLNRPDRAALITKDEDVLETSMDDIELEIMLDYYRRIRKYLEGENAEVL